MPLVSAEVQSRSRAWDAPVAILLLVAEHARRIVTSRAVCRNISRERRDGREHKDGSRDGSRILRLDSVQLIPDQLREQQRGWKSDRNTGSGEQEDFAHHHPYHA